jgi:hypothetical protein
MSRRVWSIAVEHGVEEALEALLEACSLVRARLVEASYRLKPHGVFKALARKALHGPLSCNTLPNILRYSARRDLGLEISARLTRRSYRESRCKHRLRARS